MANLRHPTWRMESSTSSPTGIRRLRSDVRHGEPPSAPKAHCACSRLAEAPVSAPGGPRGVLSHAREGTR